MFYLYAYFYILMCPKKFSCITEVTREKSLKTLDPADL